MTNIPFEVVRREYVKQISQELHEYRIHYVSGDATTIETYLDIACDRAWRDNVPFEKPGKGLTQ